MRPSSHRFSRTGQTPWRRTVALWAAVASAAGAAAQAQTAAGPSPALFGAADLPARITELARQGASAQQPVALRVEVEVGTLDPRLQLAPCQNIQPYLPAGVPAWGRTRIGLKCAQGPKAWNVSLPVTVHVWRQGVVLKESVPTGTPLRPELLMLAEVDLAAGPGLPLSSLAEATGRQLGRPLAAGATVRLTDLKARQWFAAGEMVKVVAGGPGWSIATDGQALSAGIEGTLIRVRTENGKLLQGRPVADRLVEITL